MADKSLKIGIQSDVSKGKELLKFLNELSNVGNATAKAFKSINLGAGSSALQGSLAKSLLDQKKLFSDLGQSGEKLSSILTKQVGKASEDLSKKLDETNKKLKKSIEDYEKYSNKIKDLKTSGGDVSAIESKASAAQSDINRLLLEKGGIQKAQGMLGKGEGGSGGLGGLGGLLGKAGITAGIAGAIGAALIGAMKKISSNMINAPLAEGRRLMYGTDLTIQEIQGMGQYRMASLRGDIMRSYFKSIVDSDSALKEQQKLYGIHAKESATAEHGMLGAAMSSGNLMGLASGAVVAGLDYISFGEKAKGEMGLTSTPEYIAYKMKRENQKKAADVAQVNAEANFYDKMREIDATRAESIQDLVDRAPHRMNIGRRLGSLDRAISSQKQAASWGMDEGIIEGIKLGLVSAGGRSALKYGTSANRAALGGVEGGAAAAIAGAGAVNGDLLAAMRRPGISDPAVMESLGRGAAQFLGAGNLLVSNEGLVRTLSSGISGSDNSALQLRALQQNMMGMQVGQTIFKGGDNYQKSQNLMNAIDALGDKGNIYAQNKLANIDYSTITQILNDPKAKIPIELSGMGITREALEKYATSTRSSSFNRYYSDGRDTPATKLVEYIKSSYGGDYRAWAKAEGQKRGFVDEARMLSGILPQIDAQMGDEASSYGYLMTSAGRDTGGKKMLGGVGKNRGKNESDLAANTRAAAFEKYESAADKQEKAAQSLRNAATDLEDVLKLNREKRIIENTIPLEAVNTLLNTLMQIAKPELTKKQIIENRRAQNQKENHRQF